MEIEEIKNKKSIKELLEFGIINIDKSSGPTSFNVSDFVRKKLNIKKTAHFGTLDPKVTGVLPIALNRACKLTGFFLGEDKEYVGIMRVHKVIELKEIKEIIENKFLGKIKQIPPVKSRVKRQEREREIKKFKIIEVENKDILFNVECQGGTYIRKLCDDIGKETGVGAHMLELRRTRAGIFNEKESFSLYDFEKAVEEYEKGNEKLLRKMIIPAEIIFQLYPIVKIKEKEIKKLYEGKTFFKEYLAEKIKFKENTNVCIFSESKFIGIYKTINEKDIFAKPLFVFQPLKI